MRDKLRQIRDAYRQLREIDPRATVLMLLAATLGLLAGVGLGLLLGSVWLMPILGLLTMLLGGTMMFSARLRRAQFQAMDGQLGAAAAVLNMMRGQWFVTPAVAVNAKQDMVHRLVGRCGVVLVGEGSAQRVKGLLATERKRLNRLVGDAPVTTLVAGDLDGQVPLKKLQATITKLPRPLKKGEVPRLDRKLKSVDKALPIPKGIDPMAMVGRKRPKPR